jgi:hypothetical protein
MDEMMFMVIMRVPVEELSEHLRYEDTVLPLLAEHGVRLERRVSSPGGDLEVHLLTVPSEETLRGYEQDPRRLAAAAERGETRVRAERIELTYEDGPQQIRFWRGYDPVPFMLLLEGEQTLEDFDLLRIADILDNLSEYLQAGRDFAYTDANIDEASHPLTDPGLTFWPGDEWMVHFTEGAPDEYGVAVAFSGRHPIRIDDLSEGEIIE